AVHEAHHRPRGRERGDDGGNPAAPRQGGRCVPGLSARAAQERSRRIGRHLPAQGRAAPAGQCRDLSGAGREHSLSRDSDPVMAGPSEQDKLSEDWGIEEALAAARPATPAPTDPSDDALSAEWAAMLDADPAKDDAAGRVLNQDEIDSLLGFDPNAGSTVELSGVQALI